MADPLGIHWKIIKRPEQTRLLTELNYSLPYFRLSVENVSHF